MFETQDEKSPMLERSADTLLPSVEAAATDWFSHSWVSNGESRVFIPVIVTNATLYTCSFDAGDISMADGNLPAGAFQAVPFIRFRKGLARVNAGSGVRHFRDANRQQRRTMLIINAVELSATLKQLTRQVSRGFGRQEGRRPVRLSRLQAPATRRISLISRKRWSGSVGEGTKPKCS
ncbi:MAG: hypothetical protein ACP5XB_11420 [Isosphaeraceae bacterium]